MQAFLETVVKGMVQFPDEVGIHPIERRGEVVYEIRVHPTDVGRLVGRRGNTINAIRTLLTAGASRKGLRCTLELLEERGSGGGGGREEGAGAGRRDRDRDRDRSREPLPGRDQGSRGYHDPEPDRASVSDDGGREPQSEG